MDWKATFDSTFSDCLSRRNLVRLGLFWLAGVILFAFYTVLSGRLRDGPAAWKADLPASTGDQTGALTVWQRGPSPEARPAYKVVFDNLRVENGNLGVFKTASSRIVYLDKLQATFFSQGNGADAGLRDFHGLFAPRRDGHGDAGSLGLFDELQKQNTDWSMPVDMSNTEELRVRGLDWRVQRDDCTVFHVRSQHAVLRGDRSRMVLRGRVTVTMSQAVLESNCIEIDVSNESIYAPGRYALRHGGATRMGLGGRFRATLRPAGVGSWDREGDQGWANGLQPGSF